jgi:diphosphomevalonate decarboxylase
VRWGAEADSVQLDGRPASTPVARRTLAWLDRLDPERPPVSVISDNDFPTGSGLASSASGFAALAVAASAAARIDLDLQALSALARQGSGSACRSLWGGFVAWHRGQRPDGRDSHGAPIAPPDHWDLSMVVAIVDPGPKGVGSTEGMERSRLTSPLFPGWVARAPDRLERATEAVLRRDLPELGQIMEQSTFEMHATMHTSEPPLLYWLPGTVAALHRVFELRSAGVGAWATMDAGPQVKILCASVDAPRVRAALEEVVPRVVVLRPGPGASLVDPP